MAKAKTAEFSEIEIEIAEIAKALSHPARIKILKDPLRFEFLYGWKYR